MKHIKKFTLLTTMAATIFLFGTDANANTDCGEIELNSTFDASVLPEDTNVYSFNVQEDGVIVINGDFDSQNDCNIKLLDLNGKELLTDSKKWEDNNITGKKNLSMPYQISEGKYYITIENTSDDDTLTNSINLKYTPTTSIASNGKLSGTLLRDEVGIYKVTIDETGYFCLTGDFSEIYSQDFELYNSSGEHIDDDNVRDGDWIENNATGIHKLKYNTISVTAGTYYIKIINKSDSTLSYNVKLTSKIPATKVKLNKSKLTLKKGKTYTLKATLKPAKSTDKLKWKSTNKKVATVNSKGKIKAKGKGTAYITVTTTSGTSVKCKVTVK